MGEDRDKEREEFSKALRRLPPPITCFSNGACCPWCGGLNKTVTFGMNNCEECGKEYAFGYPDWHDGKDLMSWVPFPWREFDALGGRADVLPEWKPNERLQQIYFEKTEEKLGVYADDQRAN